MNRNKKIIVGILIAILMVIFIIVAYKIIEKSTKDRENLKLKTENINPNPIEAVNQEKDEQIYSKVIDNLKLELNIPCEWKYKEMPRNEENNLYKYKYALKLYRSNESQYAMLYFYNNQFSVCGTGRTSKNIDLNNGKQMSIGYYDGKKEWNDISFNNINKHIAVMNYGLIDDDADSVIQFIKTINITENNL